MHRSIQVPLRVAPSRHLTVLTRAAADLGGERSHPNSLNRPSPAWQPGPVWARPGPARSVSAWPGPASYARSLMPPVNAGGVVGPVSAGVERVAAGEGVDAHGAAAAGRSRRFSLQSGGARSTMLLSPLGR